jgi:hypothetical protein
LFKIIGDENKACEVIKVAKVQGRLISSKINAKLPILF